MEEEWKDIPSTDGIYQASSLGRIRKVKRITKQTPSFLSQCGSAGGTYLKCCLNIRGTKRFVDVHRLVAEAFIGIPEGMVVNHIDFDTRNNKLSNLEVVTIKQNIHHTYRAGRHMHGERHVWRKICPKAAKRIAELRETGISQQKIAEIMGISQSNISKTLINMGYRGRFK